MARPPTSPAKKALLSAAMKSRWADPEFRARHSERLRKMHAEFKIRGVPLGRPRVGPKRLVVKLSVETFTALNQLAEQQELSAPALVREYITAGMAKDAKVYPCPS